MNNMSTYIIHEIEQRRRDTYKREIDELRREIRCESVISNFKHKIKRALNNDDNTINTFSVKFPYQCIDHIKKYLSDQSIIVSKYDNDKPDKVMFYNNRCKKVCASFYKSCHVPKIED